MPKQSSDTTQNPSLIQRRAKPSGASVVQRKTQRETLRPLKGKRGSSYRRPRLTKESGFVITQRIVFAVFFSLIVAVLAGISVPDAWNSQWPLAAFIGWGIFATLFVSILCLWPAEALIMTDAEWNAWKGKWQKPNKYSYASEEEIFEIQKSQHMSDINNPLDSANPMSLILHQNN